MSANAPNPSLSLLDRHQLRRLQQLPTLTVLSGSVNLGANLWHVWNRRRGVPVVRADSVPVAVSWAAALARHNDLGEAVVSWLTRSTGKAPEVWRARLSGLTLHDLDLLWQAALPDPDSDLVAGVCRKLLEGRITGEDFNPRQLFEAKDGGLSLVSALAPLVPPEKLPALLLTPAGDEPDPVAWLAGGARLLGAFIAAVPALPAAIAAAAEVVEAYLRQAPGSHYQALVREGLVPVRGLDPSTLGQRLATRGVDPALLPTPVQRLAADGVSEELAEQFTAAARSVQEQGSPAGEDRARSAAERFLMERLDSLAATAGLFALNQRLEFRHGPAPAEVDFLAADLRLVIELDGSYYHLNDQNAYRRDRRKDWQLQRHGYLVLRFLADDVVRRLEEILDTILAAVQFRRRESPLEERAKV